uniref:Uncharacterized protein n=1 Tax=Tanacetum cinerariifolium TaxID=118510 RepID=A0A6L2KHC7_TANCI|nr:hypothetical protein [Tanacetum cinerariifolium]
MDDFNITMEEYIRLEKEKTRRRGKVYNWETAMYEVTLSCEPTVCPLNDKKIEFRISFEESDDEDYTVIFDKNSFSLKIFFVDNLKTDSENDNDKVNVPSFPSPELAVSYFNDFDFLKDTYKLDFLTEPTDNDDNKIDIKQYSRDNVINTEDGAYAQSAVYTMYSLNEYSVFNTGINTAYPGIWIRRIDFLYSF